ncbi:MAG: hypothetical protein Kow0031_09030 [Anaerolineae bacterium]
MSNEQTLYTKPSARPRTLEPERRLVAAVVLQTALDLAQPNPRLRGPARAFFDEEGIRLAAAFGIPVRRIRQVVEAAGG